MTTTHEIRTAMLNMSKAEVARIHELRKSFVDAPRPYGHLKYRGRWVLSKRQALHEAWLAFWREKEEE